MLYTDDIIACQIQQMIQNPKLNYHQLIKEQIDIINNMDQQILELLLDQSYLGNQHILIDQSIPNHHIIHVLPHPPKYQLLSQKDYVRHGCSILKNLSTKKFSIISRKMPLFEEENHYFSGQKKIEKNQIHFLFKNISKEIDEKQNTIELIRLEDPQGQQINVSYCEQLDKWIVSNSEKTHLLNFQEQSLSEDHETSRTVEKWRDFIKNYQNSENLKKYLREYTICGKFSEYKQINWYSCIQNNNQQLCSDVSNAEKMMKTLNLKFAVSISLGFFNNKDQLTRSLETISNKIKQCHCETEANKAERSLILFVSSDRKIIGGLSVKTNEDKIYEKIRQMLIKNNCEVNQLQNFLNTKLFNQNSLKIPYPIDYYLNIFRNLKLLKEKGNVNFSNHNFYDILKLSQYLNFTKLNVNKFGTKLFQNSHIMNQISNIAMSQFGPLGCKTILIYYFITPDTQLKRQLFSKLKSKLQSLKLNFQHIQDQEQSNCITKIAKSEEKLSHFALNFNYRKFQLKRFKRLLQKQCPNVYFKHCFILQKQKFDYIIDENSYPFSSECLINSYHRVLKGVQTLRKIDERAKYLRNLTEQMQNLKNIEKEYEHTILIDITWKQELPQFKKYIEKIFKEYKEQSLQIFRTLMVRLNQRNLIDDWELSSAVRTIISNSYSKFKPINFVQQMDD